MKAFKITLLIFLVILSGCSESGNSSDIKIAQLTQNSPDKPKESHLLINKPGNVYGWVMHVADDKPVTIKEEIILPQIPLAWNDVAATSNIYTQELILTPKIVRGEKVIFSFCELAEGDPNGKYVINLYNQGSKIKTLEFTVQ